MPLRSSSNVSRATQCPGNNASKSLGFLNTFWRLTRFTFPKWVIFCGNLRRPPRSRMRRPMVLGVGQARVRGAQNSLSKGKSFSLPRLGYAARRRFSSAMIRSSQRRLRLVLGVRLPGFRDSTLPPPWVSFCFQLNRVRLLTLNASRAASMPCFSQNTRISYRRRASGVIISLKRTTSCQPEMKPLV